MNRNAVRAIAARDLATVRRNLGVLVPMLIVPVALVAMLSLATFLAARTTMDLGPLTGLLDLTGSADGGTEHSPGVRLAIALATYVGPPLLIIVSLLTASVMATDSVAGERERGTIEGLLLTPVSDRDILMGKLVGALVPALVLGLASQLVYAAVAVAAIAPVTGSPPLPTLPWAMTVLWFGPAFTTAALGLTVFVSARARTVQAAHQVSGVGVIPLVALVVGQATGLFLLYWWVGLLLGALFWAAAYAMVRMGGRVLQRENQIATLV
ncbi:ABC transporter permease subunit [Nocardiopsis halotolerans]|uniref:ABC transporter permease subunit n=1 Tax=Nocardiopsis halotolerans TaxID=124252 RepID=UPI0003804B7D|nr:ABC transporter permease subunit [Nocardiopsis halotolerans]